QQAAALQALRACQRPMHPQPVESRLWADELDVVGSHSGNAAYSGGLVRVVFLATESQKIFRSLKIFANMQGFSM
ncbi:MAG TPA: hypothetical protein PLW35_11750, partial [Verrucomicrobiota bacterium]|nr:hypothetical protein [Verrucomicrobiota bacterium]